MAGLLSYAFGGGEQPNLPYNPPQMPDKSKEFWGANVRVGRKIFSNASPKAS